MAFIRYKTVDGRRYYQVVKNYREGGKHRQKVLGHLGVHDSIEAALAAREKHLASHEARLAQLTENAALLEEDLRERYMDDEYLGEIPSEVQAQADYEELLYKWDVADAYYDGFYYMEELHFKLQRADQMIRYHTLLAEIRKESRLVRQTQQKLDNLRDIQTTYF